ncbi:MAG: substrate-binding domain-containing protein [Cytophagales bacterium]|nr:substrate-binding domain-containing protein [Cytophagales bacterium]
MKVIGQFTLSSLLVFVFLGFISCGSQEGKVLDTPTTGEITIAVDESFYPLISAEMDTFHALYKYAKVNVRYVPEGEAFRLLLSDSVRLAVVTRNLTDKELPYFEKIKITPRMVKVATDAVAIIVHPSNSDTLQTFRSLQDILTGKSRVWPSNKANIIPVFDNNYSGNFRYVVERLGLDAKNISPSISAAKSNPEVIEYVKNTPGAIGFIGVNWISDGDDPVTLKFLNGIRVVSLAERDTVSEEYYPPFQYAVALKKYPFTRELQVVSREARSGLGTGLTAFFAGDKGQRIVLKAGLLPATAPIRLVSLKH